MAPGKKLPGLGEDPKAEYVLARFEEPLPKGRKELLVRIESILDRGGVQKLTVELGRPIQVVQLVEASAAPPAPMELPPDDLWGRAYNREMVTSSKDGLTGIRDMTPYAEIFFAFQDLHTRKLKPKIVFYHDANSLREWLSLGPLAPIDTIFGVDTRTTSELPDDAALIVGVAQDEEMSDETLGILLRFDLPLGKKERKS